MEQAAREKGEALLEALSRKDSTKARQLLEGEVDVNVRTAWGHTPLILAIQKRLIDIACLLLDRGADTRPSLQEGSTALTLEADMDEPSPALVGALLDAGAPVNAARHDGWTTLMLALKPRSKTR